jgi:hypothetical protein
LCLYLLNTIADLVLLLVSLTWLYRDEAFEEDAVATGAAAAAPDETEEDFAQRASAFNALAEVNEDEEEDG